jgi:hypothetical protein
VEKIVELGTPQMTIWRMRDACWIPKATNTHSGCVILIALPLQQWLHRSASTLRYTFIVCLVITGLGFVYRAVRAECLYITYILESNPHPFCSFRGLKNQMRIRIVSGLDSRSRAGFWKNDRDALGAVRTIK